jgi:predicted Zn-dependent protease
VSPSQNDGLPDCFKGMTDDQIRDELRRSPFMPTGPPTRERVDRALKRAEEAGVYDPKTGRFVWDD